MKLRLITQATSFLLVLMLMASCSSSHVVHFPGSSSKRTTVGNLPPGQAKKVYGQKSAKAFAPGQQKKKGKGKKK